MSLDLYLYADIDLGGPEPKRIELWSGNVTHNLGAMADAAGIYDAMWRPKEHGITTAGQMIDPLGRGLASMKAEPEKDTILNPKNGWGTYDGLVEFVARLIDECKKAPKAKVSACT